MRRFRQHQRNKPGLEGLRPLNRRPRGLTPSPLNPARGGRRTSHGAARTSAGASSARTQGDFIAALWGRRRTPRCVAFAAVLAVAGAVCLPAPAAQAFRPLLSQAFLATNLAPPEGQLEDPCGLAVTPGAGGVYLADYYHRVVDLFSSSGDYDSQVALPGGAISGLGVNKLGGVCGLAVDASGDLYADEWHEGVERLLPSEFSLDSGESTGVAVDAAGDVFVDDRTYIAEYAAPVEAEDPPSARIGEGVLRDGYGIAVSPSGERIYVADAASGRVEVFEPAAEPPTPAAMIAPPLGFASLVDSALAIDPSDGHLLVLDDLQPGHEHPEAAVAEFEPDGTYLGQIKGPAGAPIVDGEPSGLAVDAAGELLVTSGNGELGNAFKFGPDPPGEAPDASSEPPAAPARELASDQGMRQGTPSDLTTAAAAKRLTAAAAKASDVVQHGKLRVSVDAAIAPRTLPRRGTAPISFSLDTKIASTDGSLPPQLRTISVEINRNGRFERAGLPVCSVDDIQPSTTEGALAACRSSLVGEGSFAAKVLIAQQAPFPSSGKILAFNGRWHGRPAILAHIYGTEPVSTSFTLPFVIDSIPRGTYGTKLTASLPDFTSRWGYVTDVSLELGRSFRSHGAVHSYLIAGCPAPSGFPSAVFPLSRAILGFAGRGAVSQTLTGTCRVR